MAVTITKERRQETDRMFHLACKLFKQWYADWPTRVGLAYSSRYHERRYDYWIATDLIRPLQPVNWLTLDEPNTSPLMNLTKIDIDAAYIADDEVLCAWENFTVKMAFVFTEHGYHCICQELQPMRRTG